MDDLQASCKQLGDQLHELGKGSRKSSGLDLLNKNMEKLNKSQLKPGPLHPNAPPPDGREEDSEEEEDPRMKMMLGARYNEGEGKD